MTELGNFMNETLLGRLICVLIFCLAVYIAATRKGDLEDKIKRLRSVSFYLSNVVVLSSLLTILGLLKFGFASVVIISGFILQVGMQVIIFHLEKEAEERETTQKFLEDNE